MKNKINFMRYKINLLLGLHGARLKEKYEKVISI